MSKLSVAVLTPFVGALLLTGSPSASPLSLAPSVGSLSISGQTGQLYNLNPSTATLTLSNQSPVRVIGTVLTVPQGSLFLTQQRLDFPITVSTGSLALTGKNPDFIVGPPGASPILSTVTGALTFGDNPNVNLSGNAGSLTLSGMQGSLLFNTFIQPSVATLTATGITGSIIRSNPYTPSVGTLSLTTTTPTMIVDMRLTPSVGNMQFSTNPPAFPGQSILTASTGSLQTSGISSVIGMGVVPSKGTLSLTGNTPSLLITQGSPMVGSLALTGSQPVVSATGVVLALKMRKTLLAMGTRTQDRQKVKGTFS